MLIMPIQGVPRYVLFNQHFSRFIPKDHFHLTSFNKFLSTTQAAGDHFNNDKIIAAIAALYQSKMKKHGVEEPRVQALNILLAHLKESVISGDRIIFLEAVRKAYRVAKRQNEGDSFRAAMLQLDRAFTKI